MARKDLPNPNAPNYLQRVREEIHAMQGKIGEAGDRAMTLRDAVQSGVIAVGPGGSLIPGSGVNAPYEQDLTPPPPPSGLSAITSGNSILVTIDPQTYRQGNGPGVVTVYGAKYMAGDALPTFSAAAVMTEFPGDVHSFPVDPGALYRIWAKSVSRDGVPSAPAGGTNGVDPTPGLLDDVSIANLTASRIRSGSVTVGQYIQSAGYVAGSSGWRINGDGTAEFSGVVVRGTIFATSGLIGGNKITATAVESPLANGFASGIGFHLGSDGRARFGNPTGARIQWTGSAVEIYNSQNQLTLASGEPTFGRSANLLRNSDLPLNANYWAAGYNQSNVQDVSVSRNLAGPDWKPVAGNTIGITRSGTPTGVWDLGNAYHIPVVPGRRYEASGKLARHRCNADIGVVFGDVNGNYITEFHSQLATGNGGKSLSSYSHVAVFCTAPENAAYAYYIVRSYATGEGNPFTWLTEGYFGEAGSAQTQPSPWSPANFTEQINAGNASTYIANAAIGSAQIANAAIGSAQIGNAAVDTIAIKGNAVTVVNTISGYTRNYAWQESAWMGETWIDLTNASNPAVAITVVLQAMGIGNPAGPGIRVYRNGNLIWQDGSGGLSYLLTYTFANVDFPGAGVHKYELVVGHFGDDQPYRNITIYNPRLFASGAKK